MLKYHVNLNPDVEARVFEDATSFFADKTLMDIVIMDYGLPDMTGDELLTKLRNERSKSDVIVVSAQKMWYCHRFVEEWGFRLYR